MSIDFKKKIKFYFILIVVINFLLTFSIYLIKILIEMNSSITESYAIVFSLLIMNIVIVPTISLSMIIILIIEYFKEKRFNKKMI